MQINFFSFFLNGLFGTLLQQWPESLSVAEPQQILNESTEMILRTRTKKKIKKNRRYERIANKTIAPCKQNGNITKCITIYSLEIKNITVSDKNVLLLVALNCFLLYPNRRKCHFYWWIDIYISIMNSL